MLNCIKWQNSGIIYDIERKVREVSAMRVVATLECTQCKRRNYSTEKNKKNNPDRMEIKKYCKFCGSHTLHKETK